MLRHWLISRCSLGMHVCLLTRDGSASGCKEANTEVIVFCLFTRWTRYINRRIIWVRQHADNVQNNAQQIVVVLKQVAFYIVKGVCRPETASM